MRVIDHSPEPAKGSYFSKLQYRIQQISKYGLSWNSDQKSQEIVVDQLAKVLNNRFILIRNLLLSGFDFPIPIILVGPPGLFVIYPTAIKGIFRAKNEIWATMNSRKHKYEAANPNLITRTLEMVKSVEAHLIKLGYTMAQIQGVVLLTNPGTHVDSTRPPVRFVLADGIENYIAGLMQSHTNLSGDEVQSLVDLLTQSPPLPPPSPTSLMRAKAGTQSIAQVGTEKLTSSASKVRFKSRQWLFLGIFLIVDLLVLMVLIIFFLLSR